MESSFFKLLAAYAPTSQNESAYDEKVIASAKRCGVEPINIDNSLFQKLYASTTPLIKRCSMSQQS